VTGRAGVPPNVRIYLQTTSFGFERSRDCTLRSLSVGIHTSLRSISRSSLPENPDLAGVIPGIVEFNSTATVRVNDQEGALDADAVTRLRADAAVWAESNAQEVEGNMITAKLPVRWVVSPND
jgi:hypothetical protein